MNAQEAEEFKTGFDFIITQGKMLSLLPLEKWLEDYERVDTTGPIFQPTLYRQYIYSGRDGMIKDVLRAAVSLKAAILKAQEGVLSGEIR